MNQRYTRLFTLPGPLYAQGSPLIILAGALLKDNQTGRVLAQLKLKNVGTKPIKAVKVSVTPLDAAGMENGQPVEHPYLDLHAARDGEFGQMEPIPFPDPTTRAFRGAITQVVFTDGSLWGPAEGAWEVLSPSRPLESVLRDKELCKEYQIQYGANCQVFPREEAGLWQCACGAWNMESEAKCHACWKNLDQLKALDLEQLKASRDARLAREQQAMAAQQAAASQAAASAPAQAPSKGNRPQWLIPGIAALLVVLVGVGVFFANRGKPASSGSSGSGGGTQSAASDDSGTSAPSDDSGSAAADDSGTSAPSDDSGSASGSGWSDEDNEAFVKDALYSFSEKLEEYAPGTTVAFSLEGSAVTLGLLADQSQFTDDEILGLANEILYNTGASEYLADGGFEISFHLFLYDDDRQMKNLQNEMMDLGFLWVEE